MRVKEQNHQMLLTFISKEKLERFTFSFAGFQISGAKKLLDLLGEDHRLVSVEMKSGSLFCDCKAQKAYHI
ncbi:hypothetical protein ACO03_11385 [Pantoea ananatis]|nr:hypothetical protein ACO03_11385 [Pantoea ananatis]